MPYFSKVSEEFLVSYLDPRRNIFLCLILFVFVSSPIISLAETAKLVVHNAQIFTMASDQRKPFNGYLIITDDGTIRRIGKGKLPADVQAKKIVDAHGNWIIPGFVSAHSHLWQAAYRGVAEDKPLWGWGEDVYMQRAIKAQAADFYWFGLLGALDHLEHGVTTAYNFNYSSTFRESNDNTFDEAQFRAAQQSGIRFIHGYQPVGMKNVTTVDTARNRLRAFLSWTASQPKTSNFLGVMINGMTVFNNTSQEAILEATLMKEFRIGNQTHYLESPDTQVDERSKFHWFKDSGLLSNKMIFGHFIHTDDFILQQTAKNGTAMSWSPLSNGRLASGVADIPKYLKMGIRVGMGEDGEASADLADPFENMRTGLYLIRSKYENATIMSPYQMLWLHTMGSADVLGIKDKVGSLEPGKFGDFLIINPIRLGAALEDPYANLVLVAAERDIDQVYVGGDLLVKHNNVLHHNLNKIQAKVSSCVMLPEEASGL